MKIKFPNVFKITKNVIVNFWEGAKVFKVDALLCLFTLFVIVAYIFTNISLDGAAAILFVYSFGVVIRLNIMRNKIKELE
jgi:glucan phosphoethanolaminetransferase (alkaline phosphatase superfamily)